MASSSFRFPYGAFFLKARIPADNLAAALNRTQARGLVNEMDAVAAALRNPIGCPPLTSLVSRKTKVAVIVTDNTRACPDDRLLPPILDELAQRLPGENITIIIGLGLHPPLDKAELVQKLGKNIVDNYKVINHDIHNVVEVGTTSRGTPVEVSRWVVEADFRISTGFIEPHFFAGYSGGCKSIAPGVSSRRSICQNHGFKMIENPFSRAGILKGNPIHEDIMEHAKMANLNFIVNVLLNGDKEITHIFAGDPVLAHEKGCEMEKALVGVKVNHKVDVTITSNSGSPLDLDLYQTCKGIENASIITRDGGIIIIASSCSQGVGPAAFQDLHSSASTPKEILQKIRREEPIGVQWQNQMLARAQLAKDIYLVSELDPERVKKMLMLPVHSIEEGLEKALQVIGSNAEVAVIPEGPLVLPLLGD